MTMVDSLFSVTITIRKYCLSHRPNFVFFFFCFFPVAVQGNQKAAVWYLPDCSGYRPKYTDGIVRSRSYDTHTHPRSTPSSGVLRSRRGTASHTFQSPDGSRARTSRISKAQAHQRKMQTSPPNLPAPTALLFIAHESSASGSSTI